MEAAVQIKLFRRDREDDWSVESDGRLHKHVATTTVDPASKVMLHRLPAELLLFVRD
jgi:hypothetical protein